jgi:hypothetical protein
LISEYDNEIISQNISLTECLFSESFALIGQGPCEEVGRDTFFRDWSSEMKAAVGSRYSLRKASTLREAEKMHTTSQLFLVRLWPGEEGGTEWWGKIQHVSSGEAGDFCGLPMLLTNLQAMLPHIESGQTQEAAPD